MTALLILLLTGCGIYTVSASLEPPFGISMDTNKISFSGFNDEPYFLGYVIWYRYNENDQFQVVEYLGQDPEKPTLPFTPSGSTRDIEVQISDMTPIGYNSDFKELHDQGEISDVHFAVSSYGFLDGEDVESGLILYPSWPDGI